MYGLWVHVCPTYHGCADGERGERGGVKLLFQDKCPSWLYEVDRGATTMWESWNAIDEDGNRDGCSFNHYAFGCVGDWMYRNILGIRSQSPGYGRVEIAH